MEREEEEEESYLVEGDAFAITDSPITEEAMIEERRRFEKKASLQTSFLFKNHSIPSDL